MLHNGGVASLPLLADLGRRYEPTYKLAFFGTVAEMYSNVSAFCGTVADPATVATIAGVLSCLLC
jgi:hypothetical protein